LKETPTLPFSKLFFRVFNVFNVHDICENKKIKNKENSVTKEFTKQGENKNNKFISLMKTDCIQFQFLEIKTNSSKAKQLNKFVLNSLSAKILMPNFHHFQYVCFVVPKTFSVHAPLNRKKLLYPLV